MIIIKVLSLQEPYATLIKEGKKKVETRSWKTNYRGKLYIHASMTPISSQNAKEVTSLVDDNSLNYGNIICSCQLVDCLYMTKEYVENMKQNHYQEYLCGIYEEGRYAYILEEIIPLDSPIKAKGQLNIWQFYNEQETMALMNDIEYGWLDKEYELHSIVDESYSNNYILQTPKEIIQNKVGFCWDQVELERYYLKGNPWHIKTYFIVHYDHQRCPTHTFLTYEKKNKYYWFEHAWEKFTGIHEYNSIQELLCDVKDKFIKYQLNNNYQENQLFLFEYQKPKYHCSPKEFYNHCEHGKYIDLKKQSF